MEPETLSVFAREGTTGLGALPAGGSATTEFSFRGRDAAGSATSAGDASSGGRTFRVGRCAVAPRADAPSSASDMQALATHEENKWNKEVCDFFIASSPTGRFRPVERAGASQSRSFV